MPDGVGPGNVCTFMRRIGVEHFVITPFVRISPNAADTAEFACMQLWRTRNLLNTISPNHMSFGTQVDLGFTTPRLGHNLVKSSLASKRASVHSIMHSRRVIAPLEELLHLLTSSGPSCHAPSITLCSPFREQKDERVFRVLWRSHGKLSPEPVFTLLFLSMHVCLTSLLGYHGRTVGNLGQSKNMH